ncbi:MAG: CesT family type III secretion system chaperone [Kiritimatiellae bacterium]|nr:CesT family type III secretion system chaperone [Kiritimatiellia bacterium]
MTYDEVDRELDAGECIIESGRGRVRATRAEDGGALILCTDLGAVPGGDAGDRFIRRMISANYAFGDTAGASLAVDPATGHALLHRRADFSRSGFDAFRCIFASFICEAERWKRSLEDGGGDDELYPDDEKPFYDYVVFT